MRLKINEKELADDKFRWPTGLMCFAKVETVEPIAEPTAQPSALERYQQSCRELAEIQAKLDDAEKELRHILAVRSELFRQHQHQQRVLVELKRAAGLIKEAT